MNTWDKLKESLLETNKECLADGEPAASTKTFDALDSLCPFLGGNVNIHYTGTIGYKGEIQLVLVAPDGSKMYLFIYEDKLAKTRGTFTVFGEKE